MWLPTASESGVCSRPVRDILVQRLIHASPERVFDVLSDHEGYTRFAAIKSAKLLRTGESERNGLGARRRVAVSGAWFEEEITAFERPRRMAYRIVKCFPPIEHAGGEIVLEPKDDGVEVTWRSRFRIAIPLLGALLTPVVARQMSHDFAEALRVTEELARFGQ
jgi:ribosome-associated toxin RatA of RatAB toxin-antitoxin module